MGDEMEFNPFYGVFPYHDFVKQEGIPVVEAYAVDCHTVPVEPWERLGGLERSREIGFAGLSEPEAVRRRCFELLPRYAVPDEVRIVDSLPHLPSGKVDRRAVALRVAP